MEDRGSVSRTPVLLSIVVLIAAVALVSVFVFLRKAGPQTVTLPLAQEDNFTILENGDAVLMLSTTASPSHLADLYSGALNEMGENAFMTAFHEGIQKEYKVMTGLDVDITDSQASVGADNETRLSLKATAKQVSKFNTSENVWEIDIRPSDENGREVAEFMFTQMMLTQQMLKSSPGDQVFDYTSTLPIKLPEGAIITNTDELSGKTWLVDFGGGNYREASLSVVSSHEVVLTERVVVTEQSPAAPDENLFTAIFGYKIFTIKYRLPGETLGFTASAINDEKRQVPKANLDTDFSWSPDSWTISYPFTQTFTYTSGGESGDLSAQVSAEIGLTETVSFTFQWYIGWDFELVWKNGFAGIEYPAYELQWFRTYMDITPEVSVEASASITGELTYKWEKELYDWEQAPTVFIGVVPVTIEVKLGISAGVDAGVKAGISLSTGASASTTFRLGVEWTKENSWQHIAEQSFSFTHTGPEITTSAEASVEPYLDLKLGAYFYGTAGPFIELKPLIRASVTPENWSIEAGFDIDAGVGFGSISDWVDLPDWSTNLYSWRATIASGRFGANNPPGLSSGSVSPTSGNNGTTFTYQVTYTDSDGDAPSYIRVYIDGTSHNMSKVSGSYTNGAIYQYQTALTTGSHSYYFQASDGTDNARLPDSSSYSGPTVTSGGTPPPGTGHQPLWSYRAGGEIVSAAISSDGNYVAIGNVNNNFYLFSKDDNTLLWSYEAGDDIQSVSISSDGSYIAVGGRDKVYLFSRTSSNPLWSYKPNNEVWSVSISSDGNYIVAGSFDDNVYFFSKDDNIPLWSYNTHNDVRAVSISSDGSYIAAGGLNVYLFSRTSSNPLWSYRVVDYVTSVALSDDGNYIVAGGRDKNVYLFSKDDNIPLWNYRTGSYVASVAISDDGNYIVAGSYDDNVYLFSKGDNTLIWNYKVGSDVRAVSISSDGSYIAAGCSNGGIYVFSRDSSAPLWKYNTGSYVNYPEAVSISSDGSYIAAGNTVGNVYLFSLT